MAMAWRAPWENETASSESGYRTKAHRRQWTRCAEGSRVGENLCQGGPRSYGRYPASKTQAMVSFRVMNHPESLEESLDAGMKHKNEVPPKTVSLLYRNRALNV